MTNDFTTKFVVLSRNCDSTELSIEFDNFYNAFDYALTKGNDITKRFLKEGSTHVATLVLNNNAVVVADIIENSVLKTFHICEICVPTTFKWK